MPLFLFVLLMSVVLKPVHVVASDKTDHPIVKAYEGSVMKKKKVNEFDAYKIITGSDGEKFTDLALEGRITKLFYATPKDRSILEVMRNYEMALKNAGADILFSCNQKEYECMKAYAGPAFGKYGITAIRNNIGRYLSAKLTQQDQTAYIAIAVSEMFTDIHVVEVKDMDTGMAGIDAAAMGKGIDADGYVIVEGIYFDTDKTTLKPESAAALQEVSTLLTSRPELSLYVVGHTDMQGSLTHNMKLSDGRAEAVVQALIKSYGVAANRLESHGVGPLAPQASNQSDAGRAKNRRVVLVAR